MNQEVPAAAAAIGPGPSDPGPLRRAVRPLRHGPYRLLTASLVASLAASGVWQVGLVYQVIALGGGPTQLSVVTTATSIGLLLSLLLGGVAADRLSGRAVLAGVSAVHAGLIATAAVLSLTGTLAVWHLAVLGFVLGAAAAFYYPAYSALVPSLLPAEELLAANGVEGVLRPVLQQAAGPALAAVLIAAAAPGWTLTVAAVLTAAAVLPLLALRRPVRAGGSAGPAEAATQPRRSVVADLREGFGYLLCTGWLLATLLFAALWVLLVLGPLQVLLPFLIEQRTGTGAGGFAAVLGAFGVGGVVGSLVASAGRVPRRYLSAMLLLWGAGTLPLLVVAGTDQLWLIAVAVAVVGATGSAATVLWGTLLQRRVPPHLLGRVSSLDFFVSLALLPVSMAAAGPVGETVGVTGVFVVAGAVPVLLAIGAIALWRLRRDESAHPISDPPDTATPGTAMSDTATPGTATPATPPRDTATG